MAFTASAISGTNPLSLYSQEASPACHNTFYTVGACGLSTYFPHVDQSKPFVAIPGSVFGKYGAAQNNKLCGKTITIKHNGVTKEAIVADQNVGGQNSIDVCASLWETFGGKVSDPSIIPGMNWSIKL